MKKSLKRILGFGLLVVCILAFNSQIWAMNGDQYLKEKEYNSIEQLEQKYGVTIKPAAVRRSAMSEEEMQIMLSDLESKLIVGQKALKDNNDAYEQYRNELKMSGRIEPDGIDEIETMQARAGLSRTYYESIGSVVPYGTVIRCNITGLTTSDAYGNTVWNSLSSHSSRLSSGYGTGWSETDFSYSKIDGGRTYTCSFTGTLEEPYKTSGVIQYYVYSEGWRIWFEAYST